MARSKSVFVCLECGHEHITWVGKCAGCGTFASVEEKAILAPSSRTSISSAPAHRSTTILEAHALNGRATPPPRATTGFSEFDRVLGGGLVEGSVILIGGDPGVGKSTLLLQTAAQMATGRRVIYISGEESLDQIQIRARRLGVESAPVDLITTMDCLAVMDLVSTLPRGSLVILDSVQTMDAGVDSMPGSLNQVRAVAASLVPVAKASGVSLVLVSHVTKEGSLAGPNVLKHAVDATVYIEADSASGVYRIVRTEKNRFGATDEVGIFEMVDSGMSEVANPSDIFISQRDGSAFGSVIFPSIEGTRPLLLEVQALVAPTAFGTGRRSSTGWDSGRLNMVLATLSGRLGLSFAELDVYVNVAGGLKVSDPAMDLAVIAALISAHAQTPLPADLAVFGEIGLAGEVRAAARAEARVREATALGFAKVICPSHTGSQKPPARGTLRVAKISELFTHLPLLQAAYRAA